MDDFDDGLGGRQAVDDVLADGLFLDARDELTNDLEGNVGFEEGNADFPEGEVDVLFGQAALAAEPVEDRLELFGQGFKHRSQKSEVRSQEAEVGGQNSNCKWSLRDRLISDV